MAKKRKTSRKRKSNDSYTQPKNLRKAKSSSKPKFEMFRWFSRPHNIFTILAIIFGLSFLIVTPPFQVPDEIAHFERAYALSGFSTLQTVENNMSGDYVPASIDSVFDGFRYLLWKPNNKVKRQTIFNAFKIPLDKSKKKFRKIDAGGYFYLSYLPQLPAIYIGKLFNLSPLFILYLGRILALSFYIVCVSYAIKSIPIAKYLLLTLALIPTSLAQAGSYNADCVLFSLSFLSLALVLKFAFNKINHSWDRDTIILGLSLLVFGVLKPIYLPLALFVLVIPRKTFKNNVHYFLISALIIVLASLLCFWWFKTLQSSASSFGSSSSGFKVEYLTKNPMQFYHLVINTFSVYYVVYFKELIGVLGYLDTLLPNYIYTIFPVLILLLTFFESNKNYKISIFQRIIFLSIPVAVVLGTILAMFLVTSDKSGLIASKIQGRYFIPVLFPLLMAFYGLSPFSINLSKKKGLVFIVYLVIVVLLIGTLITLNNRYYA